VDRIETRRPDDLIETDDIEFLKTDSQGGKLAIFVNGREKLRNVVVIKTSLERC
jgi:hypothetical protein